MDGRGGQIQSVPAVRTGRKTISQLFVAGDWIGDTTETMAAFKPSRLQALLREHGVPIDEKADVDPNALLPAWLHPRRGLQARAYDD
jgi:hypothetical protein